MSISLATLGKFCYKKITEIETGGGTYGYPEWEPKKPQVVVESPSETNIKRAINITYIEEG